MRIIHIPRKAQPPGQFDGRKIEERRMVMFPDAPEGLLHSFSTLFYWSYAWGNEDGLIAEHPHRGFEIMSVVIEGTLEHYDSTSGTWTPLRAGDVQVMRAGTGLTHAERVSKGTRFFQIWFDPDLRNALTQPPQYRDFRAEQFDVLDMEDMEARIIAGEGATVELQSQARVFELSYGPGEHAMEVDEDSVFAIFVLEGKIETDSSFIKQDDFLLVSHAELLRFTTDRAGKMFIVEVPRVPAYATLAGSH